MLAALIAAAAILTAPAGHHHNPPAPMPTTYYVLQGGGDNPDDVADCLTALGWTGSEFDGMEAIYAPTAVILNCGGRVSGHLDGA